jgi:hypothetical protein
MNEVTYSTNASLLLVTVGYQPWNNSKPTIVVISKQKKPPRWVFPPTVMNSKPRSHELFPRCIASAPKAKTNKLLNHP